MRNFAPFKDLDEHFKAKITTDYVVDGRRWVGRKGLLIATDGESAMVERVPGAITWLMGFWKVVDPLVQLKPGDIPALIDCVDACGVPKHRHMPMGALGIEIAASSWATITLLFGESVEWYGSGPCDIVVAKVDGVPVAIVGAVKAVDVVAHERGVAAANLLQARRFAEQP